MPLQLNVTIAFDSATSLPMTTTPIPPIVVLYQANQTRRDLARLYLNRLITLITAAQMLGQRFAQTLAYIKDSNNQAALFRGGGDDCEKFFADLRTALLSDLQSSGVLLSSAKLIARKCIDNIIPKVLSNIG